MLSRLAFCPARPGSPAGNRIVRVPGSRRNWRLLDQGGEDRDPAAAMRAWLDRGDPGREPVAVLGCCEGGQCAGLAFLLRRAGRGVFLGLAHRVDLVRAGREDAAAVQGLVAGCPELPGMGLAADFGY